ncbi:MAG: RNA polymerase sigma factor [Candidatus Latescibacteria bacterium]|nr:RNA polymerase sigma factor [Candidatus Latescibacterota bacterium]
MIETDSSLLANFVNGNEKAFTTLANKWQHHILNFAYRYLGDEEKARDVVQEVLLRLYMSLKKFRGEAKFSTFLFRIITNCCIDTIKKNNHNSKEISFEDLKSDPDLEINIDERTVNPGVKNPADIAHWNDIGEKIRNALMELPESQRIVIIMKEYSHMKFAEIAEITETPESTVKSRMYKGLINLKKILSRNGIKDWSDIE